MVLHSGLYLSALTGCFVADSGSTLQVFLLFKQDTASLFGRLVDSGSVQRKIRKLIMQNGIVLDLYGTVSMWI